MLHPTHRWLFPLACAALLAGSSLAAHARPGGGGHVSGYHGGAPRIGVVGTVAVRGGGGYHGHRGGVWVGSGWGGGWGWGPGWWLLGAPLAVPLVIQMSEPVQPLVVTDGVPMAMAPAAMAAAPVRPDPVIYPRNGQNAQQTEFDRQECNRWATTLPAALADASVFHRAVDACMDGRGYTLK